MDGLQYFFCIVRFYLMLPWTLNAFLQFIMRFVTLLCWAFLNRFIWQINKKLLREYAMGFLCYLYTKTARQFNCMKTINNFMSLWPNIFKMYKFLAPEYTCNYYRAMHFLAFHGKYVLSPDMEVIYWAIKIIQLRWDNFYNVRCCYLKTYIYGLSLQICPFEYNFFRYFMVAIWINCEISIKFKWKNALMKDRRKVSLRLPIWVSAFRAALCWVMLLIRDRYCSTLKSSIYGWQSC